MRNLIALFACSFVMATASANDPLPATVKPAPAPARPVPASAKPAPAPAKPAFVRPLSPAAQLALEAQAEAELSAKIAARLAEMRANQAARAQASVRARKAAKATVLAAAAPPPRRNGTHWSYEGESGPAHWAAINSDWAKCGTGNRQSPIDLRDGMKVDLEPIAFDYTASSFSVIDTGHTVQVNLSGGNYITVQNRSFELVQFHFHRPSEERINGRGFEMVVHLEHKDLEGNPAVVSVLLERGEANSLIQAVWNNLPLEKQVAVKPAEVLDVSAILPATRGYFTYMGSMTTPPCGEGVLWLVMKQPTPASAAQMALFSRLYPFNARPVQAGAGRIVKESN